MLILAYGRSQLHDTPILLSFYFYKICHIEKYEPHKKSRKKLQFTKKLYTIIYYLKILNNMSLIFFITLLINLI